MSQSIVALADVSLVLDRWPGAAVILGGYAFCYHYPDAVQEHPWLGSQDIDVKLWTVSGHGSVAAAREQFNTLATLLHQTGRTREMPGNDSMIYVGGSDLLDLTLYREGHLGTTMTMYCTLFPAQTPLSVTRPCGLRQHHLDAPDRYVADKSLTEFNSLHMLCVMHRAFIDNEGGSNRLPKAVKVLGRVLATCGQNPQHLLGLITDTYQQGFSAAISAFMATHRFGPGRRETSSAGHELGLEVHHWVSHMTDASVSMLNHINNQMQVTEHAPASGGGGSSSGSRARSRSRRSQQATGPHDEEVELLAKNIIQLIFQVLSRPRRSSRVVSSRPSARARSRHGRTLSSVG